MKDDLFDRLVAVEKPILACINPDYQFLPYRVGEYEIAHNVGRWWEAALMLQNTTKMQIPEQTERAMYWNLRALTNNPYGLLLMDRELFEEGTLNYHNIREALLAYTALIEFRKSRWAEASAEKLLDTINHRFFEKNLADDEICKKVDSQISEDTLLTRPAEDVYRDVDDTPTTGRAIEGMYWYWTVTGSPHARQLMEKAVAFHKKNVICPDGSAPAWLTDSFHTGHNHSYLGTIRGLLLYALHFGDAELVRWIYQTYKKTIRRYCCDETGYAPHDLAQLRFCDDFGDPLGDHASCADTAYIAYLLATRGGYPELLEDVERLIRGRLFYCQIPEGADFGAWGIYQGYFGQSSTIDVYALIASTLCRIYETMVEDRETGTYIHLHFSCKQEVVSVVSIRDEKQHTRITPNISKTIFVKIPAGTPEDSICVTDIQGKPVAFSMENGYLVIPQSVVQVGAELTVIFDLPKEETVGRSWVSNKEYCLTWRGNTLLEAKER